MNKVTRYSRTIGGTEMIRAIPCKGDDGRRIRKGLSQEKALWITLDNEGEKDAKPALGREPLRRGWRYKSEWKGGFSDWEPIPRVSLTLWSFNS